MAQGKSALRSLFHLVRQIDVYLIPRISMYDTKDSQLKRDYFSETKRVCCEKNKK